MAMTHAQLKDVENRIIRDLAAMQSRLTNGKAEFAAIDTGAAADMGAEIEWIGYTP